MDFNIQPEQHYPQILTYPIRLALFKLIKYAFLRLICPCSVSANQDFLGHQINTNCTWSCLAPTRPVSYRHYLCYCHSSSRRLYCPYLSPPGTDCGVALPRPADPEPRDTDAYSKVSSS